MEKTATKVFLACALGALIGSIVALQLNQYFWWLGLIIGGFIGYLSYEFKKVMRIAPKAWKMAKGTDRKEIRIKIIRKTGKTLARILFGYSVCLVSGFLFLMNASILMVMISPGFYFWSKINKLSDPVYFQIAFIGAAVISSMFFLAAMCCEISDENDKYQDRKFTSLVIALVITPILTIPLLALYVTYKLAPWIIRFIKYLFILIHSDIRLLCATDAAIGTAIGYFSGSAIIGAIAGGIFGVINYKVVSQRILRLQPKT